MKRRIKNVSDTKKIQKETISNENKKLLKKIELSTMNLIPVNCTTDNGNSGFEYIDKVGFVNLYRIESFDYISMSDDDLLEQIAVWDKFLRTHSCDMKWISINMPIDMLSNIAFYTRKYSSCKNPIYKEVILRNINEFKKTLRKRESHDFYLYIYAKTYDELIKLNSTVENGICLTRLVTEISSEEKKRVLRKFLNPYNTFSEMKG